MTDKEILSNLLEEFRIFKEATAIIILDLRQEVKILKEKLSNHENPKNSSVPPSQDPVRQIKNFRKKSNKKVGGQKGYQGSKLKKFSSLDKIVLHDITHCTCCKTILPKEGEIKSRQIFNIPMQGV